MKKKIVLHSGFLPEGVLKYNGDYIYKVNSFREGARGLGEGFPQAEWLDLELEGMGGIKGRMEREKHVTAKEPLNGRIHKYYCLDNDVWIMNQGDMKYITEWTAEEKWALAEEVTCDDEGNVVSSRDLGFWCIHNDRKKGICV